jgi:serine protease Do
MKKIIRSGMYSLFFVFFFSRMALAASADMFQSDWVADVAQKVIPSVVNISSTKTVVIQQSPFFSDPFFREFFGNVPHERVQRALGSGVIITSDGYIITNNHVVGGADKVEVRLSDERVFTARIIGTDPKSDVAIVKIDAKGLPTIPVGDTSKLRIGTFVLAVGNPFGLGQTVTMGIISALGRSGLGITDYENFIQTDAAINPGNSGGALVNMKGELIGINTAILSQSGGNVGIGFAIPVDLAMSVKNSLIRYGKVVRGWLGVTAQDIDPKIAKTLNLGSTKGLLVSDVAKTSPASTAGIKRGDVLTAINGKPVISASSLRFAVSELTPGTPVKVTVFRDGKEWIIPVTIGDLAKATVAEDRFAVKDNRFLAGLTVSEITPTIREILNLDPDMAGIVVLEVTRGTPAESTGIRPGDLILKINDKAIKDLSDFKKAVAALTSRKMSITIYRNGMIMSTTIIR